MVSVVHSRGMVPPAVAMMVAGYMSVSVTSMARVMVDTVAACPRQGRRRRDEKYNHGDQVDIPEPLHALGGARRGHRLGLVSHYSLLRWEALAARAPSSDAARGGLVRARASSQVSQIASVSPAGR